FLAGYQLFLSLPPEWQTIRAAQLLRTGGATLNRSGKPKLKLREAMPLGFTVLIVVLRRSARLPHSLHSRAFGLKPRTVYRPIPVRGLDVLLGFMVCAGAIAYCLPWI